MHDKELFHARAETREAPFLDLLGDRARRVVADRRFGFINAGCELACVLGRQQLLLQPAEVRNVLDGRDQAVELFDREVAHRHAARFVEHIFIDHRLIPSGLLRIDPSDQRLRALLFLLRHRAQVVPIQDRRDLVAVFLIDPFGLERALHLAQPDFETAERVVRRARRVEVHHLVALLGHRRGQVVAGQRLLGGLCRPHFSRRELGGLDVLDRLAQHDPVSEFASGARQRIHRPAGRRAGLLVQCAGQRAQFDRHEPAARFVVHGGVSRALHRPVVDQFAVALEHALIGQCLDRVRFRRCADDGMDQGFAVREAEHLGHDLRIEPFLGDHAVLANAQRRGFEAASGEDFARTLGVEFEPGQRLDLLALRVHHLAVLEPTHRGIDRLGAHLGRGLLFDRSACGLGLTLQPLQFA